jgi:ring-1,2-phenylacetyl-CoA epoxidase subunit PaaD
MIERDVVAAVQAVAGVRDVRVRFRFDPPWTPARISEQGREELRRFGIAPPGGATGAPRPDGRPTLPLAIGPSADPRPCPYCGSDDTAQESPFGPTPCRDLRFCASCQQPFEAFKTL